MKQKFLYLQNRGLGDYVINRYIREYILDLDGQDILSEYIAQLHYTLGLSSEKIQIINGEWATPALLQC